jgi:tetratricopeptide (TPR) repeat protein
MKASMLRLNDAGELTNLGLLATVLSDQGKYEQAEEICRQALAVCETVPGKENPSLPTSVNDLANVLSHWGKYEEAEEMYRQALRLRETVQGREHPNTVGSMNNMASFLWSRGCSTKAEEPKVQSCGDNNEVAGTRTSKHADKHG